jgi:probable phosphoglycerate mutase
MKKKLIYIIRHGETDFNKLGIVQGSGVDMELNARGEEQARAFYNLYKNVQFKHIYISKLVRTKQSVMPFIEAGFSYTSLKELNEISWGVYEGKQQSEEERRHYWEVVNNWNNGNYHAKLQNGESALEMQTRQNPIVTLLKETEHDCVLVCMHGRAMKSLLCTLLSRPLSDMEAFPHSNLCLYLLSYEEGQFKLLKENDISHLLSQ